MKLRTQHATCDYLTNGKEYEVAIDHERGCLTIIDDDGHKIYVNPGISAHLDGHSWEVLDANS